MHLEIDRVADDELGEIQEQLNKVLIDVRDVVEDWERMHTQVARIVEDLEEHPPPLPDGGARAGQVAAALAGRQPLHLPRLPRVRPRGPRATTRRSSPCPAPASASCAPTRTAPRVLPEAVASRARDKHLLVLAKANSRATVHRPVFLDYIGVKKFDDNGEVVGERRFLGLFSSAAYTESVTPDPGAAREGRRGDRHRRARPDEPRRQGADGRARDLPARRALPDRRSTTSCRSPRQVMYTRERRQLKLFVRRDVYGRFLSCLVYLPRDRYNTTVRERIAAILKEQLGGDTHRVHRPRGRVLRGPAALRRTPRARASRSRELDIPDLERRCAEAARSWRDDFTSAVISTYGEEHGSRLRPAPTPTASRRPTRRTTRRRPARSTSAGSRRSPATTG